MVFINCEENKLYYLDDDFANQKTRDLFSKHLQNIRGTINYLNSVINEPHTAKFALTVTFDDDMWNYLKEHPFTDSENMRWCTESTRIHMKNMFICVMYIA